MGENGRVMTDAPTPARSGSLPYLPGLDGLRALAVAAVLIYHAGDASRGGIQWLHGGYLGVEVFFVISGYLITSLLILEHRRNRTNDFVQFWRRRIRRLLPALWVMIAVSTTYAVVFLRDEVARLRGDIVAAFFYVTNWYQIATSSYVGNTIEDNSRPSIFKHLWSLAVEEQYYFIWPIVFLLLMRAVGPDRMRRLVLWAACASGVWMAALSTFDWLPSSVDFDDPLVDPTRLYEGTDTRAAGLLLGSWLAFVWLPTRVTTRVGRGAPILIDAAAVLALAWLFRLHQTTGFDSAFLYRGGMFLVSALTCVLIVATVHPASRAGSVLGNPVFRWIGLRSYGIYLWHWPVFQVTRPGEEVPVHGIANLALRLALTLALAQFSYRWVEIPIRSGAVARWVIRWRSDDAPLSLAWRRRWTMSIAAGTAIAMAVGTAVFAAETNCDADPLGCRAQTDEVDEIPDFGPDPTRPTATTAPSGATTASSGAGNTTAPSATTAPGASTSVTTVPDDPATRNVVAIGDSVMLGASDNLRGVFPGAFVDATVSRAPVGGVTRLEEIAAADGLANVDVVVVHLGTNGNWGAGDFDRMMVSLAEIPLVVVVNARMPRSWEPTVNAYLAVETKGYDNVVLLDWHRIANEPIAGEQNWFANDGFHLNAAGRAAYSAAILAVVEAAGR